MPTLAVLSLAVAGNIVLLLTLPAEVQALQVLPPSRTQHSRCNSFTLPLDGSRALHTSTLASSRLFGAQRQNNNVHASSRSALRSSTPNGSNNAMDSSSKNNSSSSSFLRAVDNFGMKLEPWALRRYEKSLTYSITESPALNGTDTNSTTATTKNSKFKSILYKIQANILWMLYIVYRGYRGFFVILPAVFKEVYRKLEDSDLVVDVYGDDEEDEKEYAVNANAGEKQQPPTRLKTRITISFLSAMLTLSYVVSGLLRVLGKFIKTYTNTTSVESSLEAAAEEVAVNEDKLRSTLK